MFSYLEERTPAEVEAIRRTIQELLRQTCILQVKYDPVTLTARDNARYQVCLKHREFIADYLSVNGSAEIRKAGSAYRTGWTVLSRWHIC